MNERISLVESVISGMRYKADNLRNDTLVSMAEGVCNERIAEELEQWVTRLETAIEIEAG